MAAQPAYVPPLLAVPQMGAVATEPLAPEAKFPGGACGPGPLSHYSGMNPIAGIPPSPVAPRQRRGSIVLTSPQVSPSSSPSPVQTLGVVQFFRTRDGSIGMQRIPLRSRSPRRQLFDSNTIDIESESTSGCTIIHHEPVLNCLID